MSVVGENTSSAGAGFAGEVGPRRAAIDIAIQIVGRLLNVALGIVATALLARGLGSSGYGTWSTVLLVPMLLTYLTDLGLQQVAVRQASAEDDPRWIGALVFIRGVVALPVILIAAVCFLAIGARGPMLVAGLVIAAQSIFGVANAIAVAFQVRVRNDLTMLGLTLNSVLWTVAVAILMAQDAGLVPLAVVATVLAGATALFQACLALRATAIPVRGVGRQALDLVRIAVPLSVGSLLIAAYGKIDGLIVYSAAGSVDAGYYGAAYRILDQAAFIPMSLAVTLAPILARTWPQDGDRARRLLQFAVDHLAMAGLFAVAFAVAAPEQSVTFLYGAGFAAAGDAMLPLMLAYAVICMGYVCGMYTLVLDLTRRFAVYALVALVFNLAGNLLLVPSYGFEAAAWMTFATELLVTALIGRDILRTLGMRLALGRLARVTAAATATALVTAWLAARGASLPVLLLAAGLVHLTALVALRALVPGEVRGLLRSDR